MGFILPSTSIEVFIPFNDEIDLAEESVEYLSIAEKPKGKLIVTNYRAAFLEKPLNTIQRKGAEFRLYSVKVNIGFNNFISANCRTERRLFMVNEILEITYETKEGISRKAIFKIKTKGKGRELLDTIRAAVAKYRSEGGKKSLILTSDFLNFIEYLSLDKAIRPLYFDSVSRCVAVGSSYFCVIDNEWNIDGSPDLVGKVKLWIEEFLARKR